LVRQLNAYAEAEGYVRTDQLTVDDMDRLYSSWLDRIHSGAKKLGRFKSLIRFARKAGGSQKALRTISKRYKEPR
jgi:hypothetical protein